MPFKTNPCLILKGSACHCRHSESCLFIQRKTIYLYIWARVLISMIYILYLSFPQLLPSLPVVLISQKASIQNRQVTFRDRCWSFWIEIAQLHLHSNNIAQLLVLRGWVVSKDFFIMTKLCMFLLSFHLNRSLWSTVLTCPFLKKDIQDIL